MSVKSEDDIESVEGELDARPTMKELCEDPQLFAREVLWRYANGKGPLTPSDADRILRAFTAPMPPDGLLDLPTMAFTIERGKQRPNYTIPMILTCPSCGERHIDEQEFAEVAHHTHACQGCGMVWRPAKVNTHGVRFLPGYENERQKP